MSLVELIIALVIVAIIVYGATIFAINSSRAASLQSLRGDIKTEAEEFLNILRVSWNTRTSYSLRSQTNAICVSNCPKLILTVAHGAAGTIETRTFTSSCVAPGSINTLTQFNALDFGTSMPNGCTACPRGQMPIVTVAGKRTVRFPHNGSNGASTFRINGILGFNACYTQNGTNPLIAAVTSVFWSQSQSNSLSNFQRSVIVPYKNFANMNINAN